MPIKDPLLLNNDIDFSWLAEVDQAEDEIPVARERYRGDPFYGLIPPA